MKTILALLCLAAGSALAQSANDYLFYKWNGSAFAKEYKTTFPASTLAGVTGGVTGLQVLATSSASAARNVVGLGTTDDVTFGGLFLTGANAWPSLVVSSPAGFYEFDAEALTGGRTLTIPDASGTLLLDTSSLSASNISSGSLALARIAQGGATSGQALVWDGTAYAPATVSAPVTSVAGRTGAITLSTSDISGLGTMATQAASSVAITGGSITGATIDLMAAYKLDPDLFDLDSIAPGETGIGWADDKFTIQTPVGAMQFYETGSPLEAVLYWPGRFQVASIEAASITGSVPGNLITSGVIPSLVMNASMTAPFSGWVADSAHAGTIGGLTFANTGPLSASEPATPGTYIAAIEVTDGGTENVNGLAGRIKTAAQLNLAERVSVPATATSTGTLGQWAVDASYAYFCTATNTWRRVAIAAW